MSAPAVAPSGLPVVALCDPTPAATNAAWRAAFIARELGTRLRLLHVAEKADRAESSRQVLAGLAGTPVEAFECLRDHLVEHHLEPPTEQEAAAPGIAKTRG